MLRSFPFGEADRILTLLCRENGKVRAIAKGVRRPTSRHSGNLESFVEVQLLMARGRDLDVVTQSLLLHGRRSLREDLGATSRAFFIVEATDSLTEVGAPARKVFELLSTALTLLDEGHEPNLLSVQYLLWLHDTLGYRPQLTQCVRCMRDLQPQAAFLSVSEGGAICADCGGDGSGLTSASIPVLKLLRNLQRAERLGEPKVEVNDDLLRDVDFFARSLAEYHAERRVRSSAFVDDVGQLIGEGKGGTRP